ncbi:ankyrin repeat-containing domain protein [Aspergillus alliaceus]|uniref:ankyrin repeat-containing domain protein n=1 Tax=Petromyces alliaceus TaxID=209559 RepID=UPI0012A5705D|nr:ankyrin repeat-containing domain protein [Aspergillus alliaceus]KAB8236553.1 ankyrin repeat-containing domain protein [Aspergillus alliaceus]
MQRSRGYLQIAWADLSLQTIKDWLAALKPDATRCWAALFYDYVASGTFGSLTSSIVLRISQPNLYILTPAIPKTASTNNKALFLANKPFAMPIDLVLIRPGLLQISPILFPLEKAILSYESGNGFPWFNFWFKRGQTTVSDLKPGLLVAGLPKLDAFYSEITMRIFDQPCPEAALARQIVIWVAFSGRPVTVSEVTDVIGAEVISQVIASSRGVLAGPELLITVCAGILIIDSKAGTLRPAHVTLETYLQRNQEGMFAQAQEYITSSSETACKEAIIAFLDNRQAVESAMQAKSITRDWQFYLQHLDSESYPHGVTGIALAAFFGLATIVEALMDNSVNKRSCSDPEGALFWAATGWSAEVIKLLLRRGISPNVRGVMRAAAENGYEDIIRILVANGGDVNAVCYEDEGNTLQTAAIKGNESLILCLLELGADPNRVAGELGSVLHIAAVNGDESITRLLLENGADPNTNGGMYGFALQAAVEEDHENIIQMLLDNGADVNLEGGPYGNAFQAAVENGDQDIVELLLAHGANINTMIGGEKYTALQEVARRGLEAMVEFLIDRGANMDSRQRNGQTALHQAAKEGQAGVVALLVQKGAKKKNFTEVARVLEAARQLRI